MNELTKDILKGAEANKSQQKRKRTTAQLPVFRDASNLLYIIMRVMYHAPRKMTKALDEAVACGTELCRSLALANEMRGAERHDGDTGGVLEPRLQLLLRFPCARQ